MMMSTRFTTVAMTVLVSQTDALQAARFYASITGDYDYVDQVGVFAPTTNANQVLVDNSVTDLDDLDQLQGKLNDAREAKDFSKCQVLNEMQELKPHEQAKVPRMSKFHQGDRVDVCGLRCNDSCLNGLVGRLVRAQDYENMSWIIKFHAEDQVKVPLTDRIKKVIGEQTSKYASAALQEETKDRDAMAIHEENMKNAMHVGDKVIFGYALIKFTYQNGKTILIKYCFALDCFFVLSFFIFVLPQKNVFAVVSRFVCFAVSDSGHLCPRKLQNQQNGRQRQKHFLRQHKNEKRQNKKCFKRRSSIFCSMFLYFYFPAEYIQGDKVILGRYRNRFNKLLNGLVGVITRDHQHQCWIVQIQEAETLPEEVRQQIREQTSGMASAEFKAEMANGDKLSVHESNMKKASVLADAQHPRVMAMQKMREAEKALQKS